MFRELVDLAAPGETAFEEAAVVLAGTPRPPLTHGLFMGLIAELRDGTTAGALLAEPPAWLYDHPSISPPQLLAALELKVGLVVALAVAPEFRRRGIATALLREAERRYRVAGFGAVTVHHEPELTAFYSSCGYSSSELLLMNLPARLLGQAREDHLLTGVKPLNPGVHLVNVPGLPAPMLGGVLPDTDVPSGVRFDGGALRPA